MLSWFDAMTAYLSHGSHVQRQKVTLQHLFDVLVQYRNRTWGHGIRQITDSEFCAEHAIPFQQGLQGVLAWLSFLQEYPLRYVKEVRTFRGQNTHLVFDYMGTTYGQGKTFVGDYTREGRLYLCRSQGEPHLCIHPFFVVSQRRLYALEYYKLRKSLHYSDCETGEIFRPAAPSFSALSQLADDRHGKLEESDVELPDPPSTDGFASNEFLSLAGQLSSEGREALEIGLGEAVRIGHFWLGCEFLLMGLSKQDGRPLSNLLHELQIDPGEFRGGLRGLVGVRTDDWRGADVYQLGHHAFDELQVADPGTLASGFAAQQKHSPVITPRVMQILREAARLAGLGNIDHVHLLLAALKQERSLAIHFLLVEAARVGWDAQDLLAWILRQDRVQYFDSELPQEDQA
jgi:hypothetical protein